MGTIFSGLQGKLRTRAARLWTQFPGEIVGDELAAWIEKLAADPGTRTMIEIGAGAGDGSTRSFVAGARKQAVPPQVFCVETAEGRVAELRRRYADCPFVHGIHAASGSAAEYVDERYAADFVRVVGVPRGDVTVEQTLASRAFEIGALASTGIATDALDRIRAEYGVTTFDVVLLDGSQFVGEHDLAQVHGARWLLLDDTLTLKNLANCLALLRDPDYRLVDADPHVRNGFAVFQHV